MSLVVYLVVGQSRIEGSNAPKLSSAWLSLDSARARGLPAMPGSDRALLCASSNCKKVANSS